MKIIQSFWTKPYASSPDQDANGRAMGGWTSERYNLMSWSLSCLKLREFYRNVELITDDAGKDLLINKLKLPYTKISTNLNQLDEHNTKLWSMGKLYAYSLQKSHFIHVDGDFFIWRKFPRRIERATLLSQHLEQDYWLYRSCLDKIEESFPFIPELLRINGPIRAANAGIIGGTDFNFYQILFREVKEFIRINREAIDKLDSGAINVILEQLYFHQLAKEHSIKIEYLFKKMADDFSDCLRFNLLPHQASYLHVIGEAKRNLIAGRQLQLILKSEYPDYFERILELTDSADQNSELRLFRKYQRNFNVWRKCNPSDIYDLKLKLSEDACIVDDNSDAPALSYICPNEGIKKSTRLNGLDAILLLMDNPVSINEILLQFEEYPNLSKNKIAVLKKELLNIATAYIFYLNAVDIYN